MHVMVTTTGSGTSVALHEPADHTSLDVVVIGTDSAEVVRAALAEAGVGRLIDRKQASIRQEALRRLSGETDASWQESFDRMVRYARTKGWVDPETGDLAAHVVWRPISSCQPSIPAMY